MEKIGRYHVWRNVSDGGFEYYAYTRTDSPEPGDPVTIGAYVENGVYYGFADDGWSDTVEDTGVGTKMAFNRPKANVTLKLGHYDWQYSVFTPCSSVTVNRFDTGVEELIGYVIDASQYADEPGFNVAYFYLGDATENAGIINENKNFMFYHYYGGSIDKDYMIYGHEYSGPEIYDKQNERFLEDAKGKTITVAFGWMAM